jgi:hypothetical protein
MQMYKIILNIRQSSIKKEYIFSKLIELQRITLFILKIKTLTWIDKMSKFGLDHKIKTPELSSEGFLR